MPQELAKPNILTLRNRISQLVTGRQPQDDMNVILHASRKQQSDSRFEIKTYAFVFSSVFGDAGATYFELGYPKYTTKSTVSHRYHPRFRPPILKNPRLSIL